MALRASENAPAPTTGRVLVLDNERTLEGDIERVGEQYRVRRTVGEVWLQAENVLFLCNSLEEAYAFLRARANLRDPDEHVRLAHWCHRQGLNRQALEHVNAAIELRPEHPESRRLLRVVQHALEPKAAGPMAKAKEDSELALPAPELNTESLSLFVTKVQPTLMNACASCHANGKAGAFKLTRTFERGLANRKTMQQNLAAVLAQVNRERPSVSPLLTKAVSVHGEMVQPALKSRDTPAYRTMEEWIRVTLESNPQLGDRAAAAASVAGPAGEQSGAAEPATPKTEVFAGEAPAAQPQAGRKPGTESAGQVRAEAKDSQAPGVNPSPAQPVDPFDPVIFNSQMHPQRTRGGKK
jgi:hypothetical protein